MLLIEVPTFESCPTHQKITTDPGKLFAVATWTNPIATDNTGSIPQVNCYPESGAAFPIGITNVTCYAKSVNGGIGTCDFEIVVTGR